MDIYLLSLHYVFVAKHDKRIVNNFSTTLTGSLSFGGQTTKSPTDTDLTKTTNACNNFDGMKKHR